MEKLRTRNRHQQPTPKPPRPIGQPALLVRDIIQELQAACRHIDRHRHPQLMLGANSQRKTRRAGSDGWCIARSQGFGKSRIAVAEWPSIVGAEVCSEADKEAVEESVEKEDEREREREAEVGRVKETGFGFVPMLSVSRRSTTL